MDGRAARLRDRHLARRAPLHRLVYADDGVRDDDLSLPARARADDLADDDLLRQVDQLVEIERPAGVGAGLAGERREKESMVQGGSSWLYHTAAPVGGSGRAPTTWFRSPPDWDAARFLS